MLITVRTNLSKLGSTIKFDYINYDKEAFNGVRQIVTETIGLQARS